MIITPAGLSHDKSSSERWRGNDGVNRFLVQNHKKAYSIALLITEGYYFFAKNSQTLRHALSISLSSRVLLPATVPAIKGDVSMPRVPIRLSQLARGRREARWRVIGDSASRNVARTSQLDALHRRWACCHIVKLRHARFERTRFVPRMARESSVAYNRRRPKLQLATTKTFACYAYHACRSTDLLPLNCANI